MSTSHTCDVVIVGAGVSGLAAAHFLMKSRPELQILLLEGGDRVGGRTLTKQVRCADGQLRDWCFGASRLGKCHRRVLALLQELGLGTCEVSHPPGKSILEIGDTIDRYEGDTPNLGALTLVDLDRSIKSLDKQAKTLMENKGSWAALEGMTLAKKIEKETWKQSTRHCLTAILEPCFDGGVDKISCLHALRIANSAGGLLPLMSDGDGLRVLEGAQAICTRLAAQLGADRILLGREVIEVSAVASSDTPAAAGVRLTTRSGEHVTAGFALLTLPLVALTRLTFRPDLPTGLRRLSDAAAALSSDRGSAVAAVSAVITYPSPPFWRRCGFTGDLLSHLGEPVGPRVPFAPVAIATEAPPSGDHGGSQAAVVAALAVLTGYTAEHSWPTPELRRADVLAHLSRFYPAEDVSGFVDYVEHDWGFGGPSGASALPVGAGLCGHAAALAETAADGRVHFAGTDFADSWIGSLEGAVQSAARGSERILARLRGFETTPR